MSITLTDVTKRFGTEAAVDGVSAAIEDGDFFVVLGPSGCGKSTLLRLIAGLETLDAGAIALGPETVAGPGLHVAPEARGVGIVFQSYALWPHMSALDNVAFPVETAGASRAEARGAARGHLATVALEAYAERAPAALSGGQRQRVALARCLAGGARVILMDEPLANLDPHLRTAMEHELARFHAATGATTLYITHDQREAMALGTRLAVMNRGRFEQVAPPETVYARPATEHVARFIGRGAILDAVLEGGAETLMARAGPLPAIPVAHEDAGPGPARVLVRPEDLRHAAPGDTAVRGHAAAVAYRGGHWEVEVAVEGLATPLPLSIRTRMAPGDPVALAIDGGWVLPS